jgi:hypothetical protein
MPSKYDLNIAIFEKSAEKRVRFEDIPTSFPSKACVFYLAYTKYNTCPKCQEYGICSLLSKRHKSAEAIVKTPCKRPVNALFYTLFGGKKRLQGVCKAFARRLQGVHKAFTRRLQGVHKAFTRRSQGVSCIARE